MRTRNLHLNACPKLICMIIYVHQIGDTVFKNKTKQNTQTSRQSKGQCQDYRHVGEFSSAQHAGILDTDMDHGKMYSEIMGKSLEVQVFFV